MIGGDEVFGQFIQGLEVELLIETLRRNYYSMLDSGEKFN